MHRTFIRIILIVLCVAFAAVSVVAQESSSIASSGSPQLSPSQSGTYVQFMSGPFNFPAFLDEHDPSVRKSKLHLYGTYSSFEIGHSLPKGFWFGFRGFYAQASGSSQYVPSAQAQSQGMTIENVQGNSTRTNKGGMIILGRELFRKKFFAPFADIGIGRGLIKNNLSNASATVTIPEVGTVQNPADDYTTQHVPIYAADAGIRWHIKRQFTLITAYHWNTGQAIQIGMETSLGTIGNGFKKIF